MASMPLNVRQRRPAAGSPSVSRSTASACSQSWRSGCGVGVWSWRRAEFCAGGAAAFEQQHFFAFAGELDGERNAGGSCADDADVCDGTRLRGFVEEVVNHGRTARAGFAEAPFALRVDRMDWIRSMMSPT